MVEEEIAQKEQVETEKSNYPSEEQQTQEKVSEDKDVSD